MKVFTLDNFTVGIIAFLILGVIVPAIIICWKVVVLCLAILLLFIPLTFLLGWILGFAYDLIFNKNKGE